MIKNATIFMLVAVGLFGILEFITRLIFASNTILNINVGGIKTYHPTRHAQLKPNYNSRGIKINSYGILGPEFKIEPDSDGVRILSIGNSVTFSPPEKPYSRVLEEKLKAVFPEKKIEVIIGAVPGYSSYEALDWYNEFLHRLKPDIAIIYLGWNDMGQYNPFGLRYKNEALSYQRRSWVGAMMENIYFLRIPYFFIGRFERSRPVDFAPLTPEEKKILDAFVPVHYSENLTTMINDLKKNGTTVYLLTLAGLITYPPTKKESEKMHFSRGSKKKIALEKRIYEKYSETLDEVVKKTSTQMIDLRALIRDSSQRDIYTDAMHINSKGSELYGKYIAENIKNRVAEILSSKSGIDTAQIK